MQIATDYNGSGIYAVRNTINGKRCVGSSIHCRTRAKDYISRLNKGKYGNQHLQSSWKKYGADAFIFEILEECADDRSTLLQKEVEWILKLKSDQPEFGYNKAYPYRQTRPSKWMSARHKAYWNSLTESEKEERVSHLSSAELQKAANKTKSSKAFSDKQSVGTKRQWRENKEFVDSVLPKLRKRLADQIADPVRWAPIGAKIKKKAKARWKKTDYRERGLKQLGEASQKAAKKLHDDPKAMAERVELLDSVRDKALAAIKARWADPEFRARRIAQLKLPRKKKCTTKSPPYS